MKNLFLAVCLLSLAAGAADVWQISDVTMKTHAPWGNEVDVDFTLTAPDGAAADAAVKLEVFASNGVERVFCTEANVNTLYFRAGRQRLVWDPIADNPGRSFGHLTVALGLSDTAGVADDIWYMTVRMSDGHVDYYGTNFAARVNQNLYKCRYMAFRRCPATTSDAWKAISGGKDYFVMGTSDPNDEVMKPRNAAAVNVRLTKDFWLGVFPVTWGQWKALGFEKSKDAYPRVYSGNDYYMAMGITYAQTRGADDGMYCFPASRAVDPDSYMGRLRTLTGGLPFDLPTEAQMEYAIRAGTTSKWYWGENVKEIYKPGNLSWAVGCGYRGVPPNAWGFYDMSDALEQWTTTLGKDANDAYYPHVAGDDPEGETPTWSPRKRVTRGTNFFAEAKYAQAAYRYPQISFGGTAGELQFTGFRVCLPY